MTVTQAIQRILAEYGNLILQDHNLVECLLRHLCAEESQRRNVNLAVIALKEGIPIELIIMNAPIKIILNRLVKKLEDALFMSEQGAMYTISLWATALNISLPQQASINTTIDTTVNKDSKPAPVIKDSKPTPVIRDSKPDPLYDDVVSFVIKTDRRLSAYEIQQWFPIGYDRSVRLFDSLVANGVVSERQPNGEHVVLIKRSNYLSVAQRKSKERFNKL